MTAIKQFLACHRCHEISKKNKFRILKVMEEQVEGKLKRTLLLKCPKCNKKFVYGGKQLSECYILCKGCGTRWVGFEDEVGKPCKKCGHKDTPFEGFVYLHG